MRAIRCEASCLLNGLCWNIHSATRNAW